MNSELSRFYDPNSDIYSEIQELTKILLRISEEKMAVEISASTSLSKTKGLPIESELDPSRVQSVVNSDIVAL